MDGVLSGFFVVGVVLLVGYLLARFNVLGPTGSHVLSSLSFNVGLPSLMFATIATNAIEDVFNPTALVSIVGAVVVMAIFATVGAIRRWGGRRTTMGALSTGLLNATNLGVPLSVYIFGDASFVTPIMLFQLAVLTPIGLTILDLTAAGQPRKSALRVLGTPFRNPATVAALLGVIVSALGIEIPALLLDPVALVSHLAVPVMLIIFGMSLRNLGGGGDRADFAPIALAVALKSVVQPVLAFVLATYVFHLEPFSVFVAVCCAILPTGQNVVIYAIRYRVGEAATRNTALITTVLAVPLLLGATLLLG